MNDLQGWIVKREYGLGWCYDQEHGPAMNDYLKNKNFANRQEVNVILSSEDRKKQATLVAQVHACADGLNLCYLIDKTNPQHALAEARFNENERFIARIERA